MSLRSSDIACRNSKELLMAGRALRLDLPGLAEGFLRAALLSRTYRIPLLKSSVAVRTLEGTNRFFPGGPRNIPLAVPQTSAKKKLDKPQ
jgi:hypothetical protein